MICWSRRVEKKWKGMGFNIPLRTRNCNFVCIAQQFLEVQIFKFYAKNEKKKKKRKMLWQEDHS